MTVSGDVVMLRLEYILARLAGVVRFPCLEFKNNRSFPDYSACAGG
jgi:hypothetical protein